ncbi:M15 family metallopeptidase [Paenibacillus xerothermodurans]|uniref:D-alanyl-D-alanine carboxypeptidase family protein n=1 Tax=Paenibacillus xerothermodurans TaxID=1977292 RepID=A0A2W1NAW9_PAEXE|nr:M15 family metallopeptidase [Paenibacillus xerothermodurans]PZE20790.1 D-alanyl-D-alanine carboxypeptidase family protein [Paenibacillus xerothermodurans]
MKFRFYPAAALLLAATVVLSATGCNDNSAREESSDPAGTGNPTAAPKDDGPTSSNSTLPGGAAQGGQASGDSSDSSAGSTTQPQSDKSGASPAGAGQQGSQARAASPGAPAGQSPSAKPAPTTDEDKTIQVVADPSATSVLVNKTYKLPDNYKPDDLVEPNVSFIFQEKLEKRKLRKEAADALEQLFAAAKEDNLPLSGVSGYRSRATQSSLYSNYVKKDGAEAADKYSAKPGHSEHETGLAIDVAGASGKCAATDCFSDTKEAKWLEQHAAEHGFIVRYPEGKEAITGYQYESWHLRYVGKEIAQEISKRSITLDEYVGQTVPVAKP